MLHIIHELQSLKRGVAAFSLGAKCLAVRQIEVGHEWRRGRALDENINTSAIKVGASILFVVTGIRTSKANGFPNIGWLVGHGASSAHIETK